MFNIIKSFCEDECLEFRGDYSGRGMYGAKCVGIVCYDPMSTLLRLCDYIHDTGLEDSFEDLLGSVELDSMGTGRIIYFPSVKGVG